jgi:hypothetical protein
MDQLLGVISLKEGKIYIRDSVQGGVGDARSAQQAVSSFIERWRHELSFHKVKIEKYKPDGGLSPMTTWDLKIEL